MLTYKHHQVCSCIDKNKTADIAQEGYVTDRTLRNVHVCIFRVCSYKNSYQCLVHETQAIVDHLLPKFSIQQQYIDNLENKWGVSSVLGQPTLCHTNYYNCKGWYSGVVDYKYCFLDIYTAWPGSVLSTFDIL